METYAVNRLNLTDTQKELLRKLVEYDREGKLGKPLRVYRSDDMHSVVIEGVPFESWLHLEWIGDLDALCDVDLMKKHSEKQYSITQLGYNAVDSDFAVSPRRAPTTIACEGIMLEAEQKELLAILVESTRNVAREKRRPFWVVGCQQGHFLNHPGLVRNDAEVYMGDIETLRDAGLIRCPHSSSFDVTPLGFEYYRWMKQCVGQPSQTIEAEIRSYLETERFQARCPVAYEKWADAATRLWAVDSEHQLTVIGHLCREAMQEFATAQVEQCHPSEVDEDKAHSVARLGAVLRQVSSQLGKTEKPFLDALLACWRTVSNLVQRQEHGAQRKSEPLVWEDGRRVVFQTAVVMFEFDRAVSRTRL